LSEESVPCGEEITESTLSVVTDVVDTLKASFGIGLAAPQVGIQKRILAINPAIAEIENPYPQDEFPDHFVVIDPELELSGHDLTWNEACLSVPFLSAAVKRKSEVGLTFTSLKGKRVKVDLKMPMSGIIQHENDHLDGILFIDRAGKFVKEKLRNKLKKELRIKKREDEAYRRQIIIETQGPSGLRKYLADKNPTKKKAVKKKSGKQFGKNKNRR